MMYRTDREAPGGRAYLAPGDVVPPNVCQPPVDAMELMHRLSLEELQDVARVMIIWAPEAFERGLERVSELRKIPHWYPARAGSSACTDPVVARLDWYADEHEAIEGRVMGESEVTEMRIKTILGIRTDS